MWLRNLAEYSPAALLVVEAGQTVSYANVSAHELFGYEAGRLCGMSVQDLFSFEATVVFSAAARESINHSLGEIFSGRSQGNGQDYLSLTAIRRDGSRFSAEVCLSVIQTNYGWATAAMVRDVTQQELEMKAANAARAAAEQESNEKSRFVAAVSHDLRQPLQALRVTNAVLQRQVADSELRAVLLEEKQSLDSMTDLLDALLNLSKLESGTVAPRISDVELNPLLQELRRQFAASASEKNLNLELTSEGSLFVGTDRALFSDLLQNLLSNAIRYTDVGSVRVRCRHAGDRIAIEISDTGIGIAPQVLPRIWEDFYQGATRTDRRRRGGAGLGLAIVRRLSHILNIDIKVKSAVGKGTCFTVEVAGAQHVNAANADLPIKVSAAIAGAGRKIIFIEDDDAVRNATSLYLKLDGYSVAGVATLRELDELLDKFDGTPSLVISDFQLRHDELGGDAIKRARAKYGHALPAIVLTGDMSIVPRDVIADSKTRLLDKPIDVVTLTSTIGELLNA